VTLSGVSRDIGASRTRTGLLAAGLASIAALAGCDAGWPDITLEPPAGGSVSRSVDGCPVTIVKGNPPVEGEDFNYGNEFLAAALWTNGRLVADEDPGAQTWGQVMSDGSVEAKVGWWRGVSGRLTIQGERLDAPAPPLRAFVPGGYGHIGFQATGLTFPTEGCWEVLGSVAGHEITFIVLVIKR
jgi:hypothetical protein